MATTEVIECPDRVDIVWEGISALFNRGAPFFEEVGNNKASRVVMAANGLADWDKLQNLSAKDPRVAGAVIEFCHTQETRLRGDVPLLTSMLSGSHELGLPGLYEACLRALDPKGNEVGLVKASKEERLKVLSRFNTFFTLDSARYCDFELKVKDEGQQGIVSIRVHQLLLSATSDFFQGKFGGSFLVNDDFQVIENVRPRVLRAFLDFIYSGKCAVNQRDLFDLCVVADQWGVSNLHTVATKKIESSWSPLSMEGHPWATVLPEGMQTAVQKAVQRYCDATFARLSQWQSTHDRVILVLVNIIHFFWASESQKRPWENVDVTHNLRIALVQNKYANILRAPNIGIWPPALYGWLCGGQDCLVTFDSASLKHALKACANHPHEVAAGTISEEEAPAYRLAEVCDRLESKDLLNLFSSVLKPIIQLQDNRLTQYLSSDAPFIQAAAVEIVKDKPHIFTEGKLCEKLSAKEFACCLNALCQLRVGDTVRVCQKFQHISHESVTYDIQVGDEGPVEEIDSDGDAFIKFGSQRLWVSWRDFCKLSVCERSVQISAKLLLSWASASRSSVHESAGQLLILFDLLSATVKLQLLGSFVESILQIFDGQHSIWAELLQKDSLSLPLVNAAVKACVEWDKSTILVAVLRHNQSMSVELQEALKTRIGALMDNNGGKPATGGITKDHSEAADKGCHANDPMSGAMDNALDFYSQLHDFEIYQPVLEDGLRQACQASFNFCIKLASEVPRTDFITGLLVDSVAIHLGGATISELSLLPTCLIFSALYHSNEPLSPEFREGVKKWMHHHHQPVADGPCQVLANAIDFYSELQDLPQSALCLGMIHEVLHDADTLRAYQEASGLEVKDGLHLCSHILENGPEKAFSMAASVAIYNGERLATQHQHLESMTAKSLVRIAKASWNADQAQTCQKLILEWCQSLRGSGFDEPLGRFHRLKEIHQLLPDTMEDLRKLLASETSCHKLAPDANSMSVAVQLLNLPSSAEFFHQVALSYMAANIDALCKMEELRLVKLDGMADLLLEVMLNELKQEKVDEQEVVLEEGETEEEGEEEEEEKKEEEEEEDEEEDKEDLKEEEKKDGDDKIAEGEDKQEEESGSELDTCSRLTKLLFRWAISDSVEDAVMRGAGDVPSRRPTPAAHDSHATLLLQMFDKFMERAQKLPRHEDPSTLQPVLFALQTCLVKGMSAGNQIAEDAATACIALLEAKSKAVRESAKQAACLHLNVVSHNPGFHRLDALTFAAIIADQDELECNHGVKILLRWAGEGGSLSDVASTAVPRLVNAFNQSSDASKSVLRSVFMEALQHVLVDAPKLQIDWLSEVDGILFEAVQHYHVKNGGRELVCHQELSTLSAQDLLRILAALSKEGV
eukprot:TRINITY_DN2520_c0_g1_i3.p1 TRINITY_DN2520_c0_g1~~TRINITY_DN2520_c0_g1_i3.p1  ORF type:complete len:1372 (-),score=300.56 TRINITY_DN2520_c0_g1_i3:695-4810(-)